MLKKDFRKINTMLSIVKKDLLVNLKDFKHNPVRRRIIMFDENFQIILEQKKTLRKAVLTNYPARNAKRDSLKSGVPVMDAASTKWDAPLT
jgi:hypothetical protein